ncbi:MAG: saccharopine dehydrogenase NADP-binding domain-containing protein [Acidobacteria bacterium]|nr:saccharopine dehydrogenase NADP-binding domain-containing protein [Acidobacteriota bacterium]MBI3425954.1 saccharopine dehydrogenase NADP-binding domain-containing protein [Acidobacteriota bacterium]
MQTRDYDVVLYGASGFTGKQTVAYFAQHAPNVRWAMAGRNHEKLAAVQAEIGASADILVADSQDQTALDAIAARTRVVLTTAGPFALYGTKLVDACVRHQTHYVDITGETVWVRELIDRYHTEAAATGTRIIPFCGFDSVPSDLGAFLMARHIQQQFGVDCRSVKAYFQMAGGVNGGTLATAFNLYESGQAVHARHPFLLNPVPEATRAALRQNQDPVTPHYDADAGAWVAPFVMGPINTRVVRRSQALFSEWQAGYGAEFSYQEYTKFNGPLGWLPAGGLAAGATLFELALQSPLRPLLKSVLPAPGQGPAEKTMNEGWFRCELLGVAVDGRQVRGVIKGQGDPGNRATVKFLCESALCLTGNPAALPGGAPHGGLLTPATGLGDILAERLKQAGMAIEIGTAPDSR